MGVLESKFSRVDLDTLIEAMGDWEAVGNHDYHVLNIIKNMPMPPEDHEAYEYAKDIKEHFLKREREINDRRAMRQEKATLLKAKLMLVRADMAVSQLFEMSVDGTTPTAPAPKENVAPVVQPQGGVDILPSDEFKAKLELAEFFIRDLGVWDHYAKYLSEKSAAE